MHVSQNKHLNLVSIVVIDGTFIDGAVSLTVSIAVTVIVGIVVNDQVLDY